MPPGTAPGNPSTILATISAAVLKLRTRGAGMTLALLLGALVAGCSITIGPQPTPGPTVEGQPTNTPIEEVRVDITRVPSPTTGPPTPTRGPVGEPIEYTIKSGDTLSGIAAEFGITVDEIVRFNNITDPNAIYEGQVILIPPAGAVPPATGETPAADVTATATMVP